MKRNRGTRYARTTTDTARYASTKRESRHKGFQGGESLSYSKWSYCCERSRASSTHVMKPLWSGIEEGQSAHTVQINDPQTTMMIYSSTSFGAGRLLICMIYVQQLMLLGGRSVICMAYHMSPGLGLYCTDHAQHLTRAG